MTLNERLKDNPGADILETLDNIAVEKEAAYWDAENAKAQLTLELPPQGHNPNELSDSGRAVVFTPEVDCLLTSLASGCPDLEEGTGADPYTVTAESTLEGLSRGALDEVLRTAYDLGLAVDAAANIEKVKRDMMADPELTLSAAHTAAFSPDSEPWTDTDEEF